MKHWIVMFRPDTYERVKEYETIGVREGHRKRFEAIRKGDRFVAYVSRKCVLDGHGTVTSDIFEDDLMIFSEDVIYPVRSKVRFDQTGADKDAKELLWGLSAFKSLDKTTPSNMIFCKGGFMEITEDDYVWLRQILDGSWVWDGKPVWESRAGA